MSRQFLPLYSISIPLEQMVENYLFLINKILYIVEKELPMMFHDGDVRPDLTFKSTRIRLLEFKVVFLERLARFPEKCTFQIKGGTHALEFDESKRAGSVFVPALHFLELFLSYNEEMERRLQFAEWKIKWRKLVADIVDLYRICHSYRFL